MDRTPSYNFPRYSVCWISVEKDRISLRHVIDYPSLVTDNFTSLSAFSSAILHFLMLSLSEDSMSLRVLLSVMIVILLLVMLTAAYKDLERDSDGDGLK